VAILIIAVVTAAGLAFSATRPRAAETVAVEPASVDPIGTTDLNRVTLTEQAAVRLGIQTVKVAETTVAGKQMKVIPYAAVLYDPSGDTWTYTQVEPLAFVRQHVTVARIDGDKAQLSEGPSVGTEVVTTGMPELYGAEYGVGEE
jgi:hypothetical protein